MHPITFSAFGLAIVSHSLAQTTISYTTTLFLSGSPPLVTNFPRLNSCLNSCLNSWFDSTATTYAIKCGANINSTVCLIPFLATQSFYFATDCSLDTSSAACAYTERKQRRLCLTTRRLLEQIFLSAFVAVVITGMVSTTPASTRSGTVKATGTSLSGSTTKASESASSGSEVLTGSTAQTSTSTLKPAGAVIKGCPTWLVGGAALALTAIA
ncbi:hypothetical protein BDZ45DRAFT_799266 [Acephala macrosclerotiorum]|nr:hypothetical protein BDZ45DRAFT_799266 [Acephala macrosclerotiorum]